MSLALEEATRWDLERQMQPLVFCYVKAGETTLWGQEAARPQQTKNKETVRLHTADVSDGAHKDSIVFCFKYLG